MFGSSDETDNADAICNTKASDLNKMVDDMVNCRTKEWETVSEGYSTCFQEENEVLKRNKRVSKHLQLLLMIKSNLFIEIHCFQARSLCPLDFLHQLDINRYFKHQFRSLFALMNQHVEHKGNIQIDVHRLLHIQMHQQFPLNPIIQKHSRFTAKQLWTR